MKIKRTASSEKVVCSADSSLPQSMSVVRTGFLWQGLDKQNGPGGAHWIAAKLEIVGRPNKLVLVADPVDTIYESVDEDDHASRFRVNSYKRCSQITCKKTHSNNDEPNQSRPEPTYQVVLKKHRILKGEEVKIGFNEKASQRLFLIYMREALKENKKLRSNRLRWHKSARLNMGRTSWTSCDINEIDKFMTENKVYEKHDWSTIEVRVLGTELATRLRLSGIFLLEVKESEMCLLDYIKMSEVYRWPFKSIRSFGFNEERLYILTGSQCVGGRGLLIFESEGCADIMNRMLCMMKSIAGESESSTEETVSLSASPQNSKLSLPQLATTAKPGVTPHNAPPTPTKKSMQDLSASLQDFCRTHCCSLPPLRGRNGTRDAERVGESDHESEETQIKGQQITNIASEDNFSLDETDDMSSREESLERKAALNLEVVANVGEPIDDDGTLAISNVNGVKCSRELTLRKSSVKKSLSTFISHSMARFESMRSAPELSDPSISRSIVDGLENADRMLPPVHYLNEHESKGFVEADKSADTNDEHFLTKEQRCSRGTESAKAVQLIKWRDLPGKEDYYSSTSNRFMTGTLGHDEELRTRGNDIVKLTNNEHMEDGRLMESASSQEDTSSPSTSTARDRQLSVALRSDMVAFTSF